MRWISLLVVAVLLVVPACGGDDQDSSNPSMADYPDMPSLPATPSVSELGEAAEAGAEYWKDLENVELTDAMMEEFFTLAEELMAASGDQAKQVAVFAENEWNWARWSAIASQLSAVKMLGSQAPEMQAEFDRMDKEIERVRAKIAESSGEQKQMLEARLAQMEELRKIQQEQLAPMMESATKAFEKNRAILEKYSDRWEKLGWEK